MTAQFPNAIYTPRTMVNRTGVTYDAARTKDIYAEDFNKDRDEIVAIEETLGLNPAGTFTAVSDRLDYIEGELGGGSPLLERLSFSSESGFYDYGGWVSDSITTANVVNARLIYVPFYVSRETSYNKIVVKIGTKSSTAGAVCRLGIYSNNGGRPGALIEDAGTFNINSTNGVIELAIDQTLSAGLYFIAMVANGTGATAYKMSSATDGLQGIPPISCVASSFSGAGMAGLFVHTSGASYATDGLPATADFESTLYNLTSGFAFALKIA